jgi:hypothetical protein
MTLTHLLGLNFALPNHSKNKEDEIFPLTETLENKTYANNEELYIHFFSVLYTTRTYRIAKIGSVIVKCPNSS